MRHPASLVAALLVVTSARAAAADEEGLDYVLSHEISSGGYAAPAMKVSTLAGDGVFLAGGEAGWILAQSLVVGGGGYATVNEVVAPRSLQGPSGDAHLRLAYGGARLGGIFAEAEPIHLALGLLLGGGSAWSSGHDLAERSNTFFVVEPDLEAELNLATHFRLALGGGWRLVGTHSEHGFTAARLGGPTATLAFRVATF